MTAPAHPLPHVDAARCVRSRCRAASCRRCVDACPTGALDDGRPPAVRADDCTGCMLCAGACPVAAVAPSADAVPRRTGTREDETVTIGCGARRGTHHDIVVPCIGAVTETDVATLLLTRGPHVRIDASRCEGCAAIASVAIVDARVRRCRRRVGRAALRTVAMTSRPEDRRPPGRTRHRRAFFASVVAGAADAVHDVAFGRDETPAPCRDGPGDAQRRLSRALDAHPRSTAPDLRWTPDVAAHCTTCRCCSAVCPTSALQRKRYDGVRRLVIDADACTGCQACAEFCPEGALRVLPGHAAPTLAGALEA